MRCGREGARPGLNPHAVGPQQFAERRFPLQAFEFSILNWIQLHCRSGLLDAVLPAVSRICDHGEVWIVLALLLLAFRKTRRIGLTLSVALLLDVMCCNIILKPLVGRVRPCDVNTAVKLLIARPLDASFPSGHTAVSFAAVCALWAERSRLWMPALALALLLAFSRLYLYVHWPSDVLAGAVLGGLLGLAARPLAAALERRFSHGIKKT